MNCKNILKLFSSIVLVVVVLHPLLFVGLGAYLFAEGLQFSNETKELERNGIEVEGRVVNDYPSQSKDGISSLRVAFDTLDGSVERDFTITEQQFLSLSFDSRVLDTVVIVKYLATDSSVASINGQRFDRSVRCYVAGWVSVTFGVIWLLVRLLRGKNSIVELRRLWQSETGTASPGSG